VAPVFRKSLRLVDMAWLFLNLLGILDYPKLYFFLSFENCSNRFWNNFLNLHGLSQKTSVSLENQRKGLHK